MTSSIRTLRRDSYRQVILCLLVSLVAISLLFIFLSDLTVLAFLKLIPTKIFLLLLFLASALHLIRGGAENRDFLLLTGIALALAGVLLDYGYSFTGVAVLGPGDEFVGTGYDRVETGFSGRYPKVRLKVEEIRGGTPGIAVVRSDDGGRRELRSLIPGASGRSLRQLFSARISALRTGVAPRFVIASRSGKLLDSAYVTAGKDNGEGSNYFRNPGLPHRIYFRVPDDIQKPISVMVTRGKLTIRDWKELRKDEKLEFEGFEVYFTDVVRWVEIEVSSCPGHPVILTGCFMILIGVIRKSRGHVAG
jgi:hypothetical protein